MRISDWSSDVCSSDLFFGWFNRGFEKTSGNYQRGVRGILGRPWRFMAVFAALALVMGLLFARLPSSFLPNEDQGVLMAMIQTPVGATQERTLGAIAKPEKHLPENETEAVERSEERRVGQEGVGT